MADKIPAKALINALIKQDSHCQWTLATTRSLASSKNANTCSLVTDGKPSKKASIDSPALMYSMKVCTGTRVPANTGVPPSISGETVTIWVAIAVILCQKRIRLQLRESHNRTTDMLRLDYC